MPKISSTGATMKQQAYARRIFGAQGKDKKSIALSVGYSAHVADSPKSKIESTRGFNNAMARLAAESNNIALAVMSEFKARGFKEFSNKDLVGALNAIGSAWAKFDNALNRKEKDVDPAKNRLRMIVLQNVENQTISAPNGEGQLPTPAPIVDAEVSEPAEAMHEDDVLEECEDVEEPGPGEEEEF